MTPFGSSTASVGVVRSATPTSQSDGRQPAVTRRLRWRSAGLALVGAVACKTADQPQAEPPIAMIDIEGTNPLLVGADGAVTSTADPLPWFRYAMVPVGDTALLALGSPDPPLSERVVMMRLPWGDVTRSVVTAELLTDWMGCVVDGRAPGSAAIAGSPAHVLLAGISVCDTSALVGLSWPEARVTGVLRDLAASLAAVPGDSHLVAAAGRRPSQADSVGRIYIVNVQTMTLVDSSPPVTANGRYPWVEIIWTDDPDVGYVLTTDARVRLYRRSTGVFSPVAADAVWSRIRFDPRRNAVLVLTPGDPFDWPGRPLLQWFSDTGEVFPRVNLAGMMPDGSDPVIRDARPDGSGGLLVLTGTERVGPLYPHQACRVFRVNDTAAAGVSVSLLATTDAYGCRNLVPIGAQ
jgi:hypothetical protein